MKAMSGRGAEDRRCERMRRSCLKELVVQSSVDVEGGRRKEEGRGRVVVVRLV